MKAPFRSRLTLRWVLLFVPVLVLFYWKILLTGQFSLLTDSEGVNQGYSWLQFWISSVRQGTLPIWDPYALAGHSFAGEMQTGAFNPLRLLLALFPFNHEGVFSPKLYHVWYAAMHFMAACFMFALVREFGLSRFPAFVAGLCFSLGGFVARMGWPDMYESAAWLPVVFLFLLRALRSETVRKTALNAALSGLAIGMTILASRLHIVIMEMLTVASAGFFYACVSKPKAPAVAGRAVWLRAGLAVAVAGAIGALAGAVQLFPSVEYSRVAYRLLGEPGFIVANMKIPYADMRDQLYPHAISYLAFAFGYVGNASQGEVANPYIGFFPLLAAVVGIRRYWGNLWVRYLSGLAVAAFLYCLGSFSPLHGLLYAVVPKLWMLREAARLTYLLDFALAILAAFGVEALISAGDGKASWPGLDRVLMWGVVACAVALFVPAVWNTKPEIGVNPWNSLSILIIFASYGLFRFMENGNRGAGPRAILVGLILFDLAAFDWLPRNKMEAARQGGDQLERILTARGAAAFLRSQPGPFRVRVQADPTPNVGDLFGVPMVDIAHPGSITISYPRIMGYTDLLNVRYFLTPAQERKPGAVYQDAWWKVYENPTGYSRAWVVHTALVEPSDKVAAEAVGAAGFDARRTALVERPVTLEGAVTGAAEPVAYPAVQANRMTMEVHAASRGMLVISENYYPGWRAAVNGQPAEIYRVDGALRGVVVPPGRSRVTLDYSPASVYWGGALTLATFLGVAAIGLSGLVRPRVV